MTQLGQLQKNYTEIRKLGAEVVCVFREEKLGREGLQRVKEKIKPTFPLANDLGAKQTARYSQEGFATYVIDREGILQAVLSGTLVKRARPDAIIKELKKLSSAD